MKPHKKPESFIRSPSFPGGHKAMDLFVKEHLKYPEEAIRMKIAGTVSVVADVDYKGHVIKTVVKKGIGFGCDEEAARVVSLMQFESLKYRGLRVIFHKTVNIHFHIPGAVPVIPEINYSYKENDKSGGTVTYQYTIK
jgi:TonB family protein